MKKRHLKIVKPNKGEPVGDLAETSTGQGSQAATSQPPELVQTSPDLLQTVVDEILTTPPWRPR